MGCLAVHQIHPARRVRRATIAAAMLACWGITPLAGQTAPSARVATRATGPLSPADASGGAQLLRRVAAKIASRPAIVAKSRFQIDLFEQHLVGSGSYHEASYADDRLLRIEAKITVAGELASFQRVSDGRYAWTRRDMPALHGASTPTVERIDLQRIADHQRMHATTPPPNYPIGGIAYVLHDLLMRYAFADARSLTHQGLPAWLVRGELLQPAAGEDSDSADRPEESGLPPGPMPGAVTLVIGQQDLFPFVIQYYGSPPAPSRGPAHASSDSDAPPIMTLEYYEVDFPPGLDPRLFIYHAGETAVKDDTESYLHHRDRAP